MSAAQPFVKWAGGKRRILRTLTAHLPADTVAGTYWEPFLGGGALLLHLRSTRRIGDARLSDRNAALIQAWTAVRDDPDGLIDRLQAHRTAHGAEHYAATRKRLAEADDPMEVGAAMIHLNRTCYNGLWRVNRTGAFNVPMGDYPTPPPVGAANLRAAHQALTRPTRVRLRAGSWTAIRPRPGDLVYCDPPYDGTFTGYTADGFGPDDQARLAKRARAWARRNVQVMLSNADTPRIRALFEGPEFRIHPIAAPRSVSRTAAGRRPAPEVIITTYDPAGLTLSLEPDAQPPAATMAGTTPGPSEGPEPEGKP